MALVIEDGSRPHGANTYAGLDMAEIYHLARATAAWSADDDEPCRQRKSAALVRATDWLNSRVRWQGQKRRWQQLMAWPRCGVVLPEGAVPDNTVPPQVVDACCELAGHFMTADVLSPRERGGQVLAESVEGLSVSYAQNAPTDTLFPKVAGLLAGLGVVEDCRAGCVEVARG